MQIVTARETSETKTHTKKTHSVVAEKVKTEKEKIEGTKPMKFGDLDDVIRVAEYEIHKICAEIEILRFKKASPKKLCVKEHPTIPFSICDLKNEMERAKNRLYLLQLEKGFTVKKRKQKK